MTPSTELDKVERCTHMLLFRLGVTPNYTGFFHVVYAVRLVIQQPECLQLVTKCLYPAIAKHYHKSDVAVTQSICTVVTLAWNRNRELLQSLANYPLEKKPSLSKFIAILAFAAREMSGDHT